MNEDKVVKGWTNDLGSATGIWHKTEFQGATSVVILSTKKYEEQNNLLYEALKAAAPHVCSLLCPSVKRTGEEWTHVETCKQIIHALATYKVTPPAATADAGEHDWSRGDDFCNRCGCYAVGAPKTCTPSADAGEETEPDTFWMIERTDANRGGMPLWMKWARSAPGVTEWTTDWKEAVRTDRAKAEYVAKIESVGHVTCIATEHSIMGLTGHTEGEKP